MRVFYDSIFVLIFNNSKYYELILCNQMINAFIRYIHYLHRENKLLFEFCDLYKLYPVSHHCLPTFIYFIQQNDKERT